MRLRHWKPAPLWATVAGAGLLALSPPASAQHAGHARAADIGPPGPAPLSSYHPAAPHYPPPHCPPGTMPYPAPAPGARPAPLPGTAPAPSAPGTAPAPGTPGTAPAPGTPGMAPAPGTPGMAPNGTGQPGQPDGGAAPEATQSPFAGDSAGARSGDTSPRMLGDQLGIPALAFRGASPRGAPNQSSIPVPTLRSVKIAENESPFPQDRVYVGFNYFDQVNRSTNSRQGTTFGRIEIYREVFGIEKTFLDGDLSIGARLPVNSIDARNAVASLGGSSTDIGNVGVVVKYALCRSDNGVLSAGLLTNLPTGPDRFAGFRNINALDNVTTFQPFGGYFWRSGNWFVHGFLAVDVPTDSDDVTILYNDMGLGWYMYENQSCSSRLAAIIPSMEVHANIPLNHRGAFNFDDLASTPDVVALTFATTLQFRGGSTLALGFVTPVTGPKPFDYELIAQFNWRFGSRSSPAGVVGN